MEEEKELLEMIGYLCKRLTDLKWFYSPRYFKESKVSIENIINFRDSGLRLILVLDRNIFSRLMDVVTKGKTNQGDTRDIAVLMSFCAILSFDICPYFAINEYSAGQDQELIAQNEFYIFDSIFKNISYNSWLKIAVGAEDRLDKIITLPQKAFQSISFHEDTTDYLSHYAALIHFAYVWRTQKDSFEKFKSFFEWYYAHSKYSRFMVIYICSVLASCNKYKLPKNINSESFENVVSGCKNQARDISYLSLLSLDRYPSNQYEMVLVSSDEMLGDIYSKGVSNSGAIRLYEKSIKKNNKKASEWVDHLLTTHQECKRNDEKYYQDLVKVEFLRIKKLFQSP